MIFFIILFTLKRLKDIAIIHIICQSVSNGKLAFLPRKKSYLFYNAVCIYLSMIFLDMIFASYDIAFLITLTFFFILSLSIYYVHEFRGTSVNLSDILSLNTAKEVASGYEYKIKPIFVIAFLLIVFEYIKIIRNFTLYGIWPTVINKNYFYYHHIISYRLSRLVLNLILFMILKFKISSGRYDYSLFAGENEGYLYNFFSSIPLFHKKDRAPACEAVKLTDLDKIESDVDFKALPHVIVVMDESFGIAQKRVKTNVEVTPFYDGLHGLTKGNLYVNTFGGGTANTEFEFLTGMSIGNYKYPVMPYNNFVNSDKYSLARYFKNLKYDTIAMHPYTATNYHRDKVYRRFGFDELLFYNEFTHRDTVRNFVSDEAFYKEVIHQYEVRKNGDKKLFMFGITMQNHSGYQKFDGMEVSSELNANEDTTSLDSYLSLMKISDSALKTLIDYFEKKDERVVVLFFGDHNASFGTNINKCVYDDNIDYECNIQYQTPFFIYDNKDKTDEYIEATSANFLSLELIRKAKLPYDRFHSLLNGVYDKYSVYNYHKRKNRADGKLTYIDFDDYMKLEEEYLKK